MATIKRAEEAEVPDGPFCVDYSADVNAKACRFMNSDTSRTDWRDGLGSPGTITHYTCSFFRYGLAPTSTCPLTVPKCHQCLAAQQ